MSQELVAPETHEIIAMREQFYTTVSFDTHYVFCFDEREAADIEAPASTGTSDSHKIEVITPDEYIHWAGGGLNPSYNLAIMDEATKPWSVTGSFESHTGTFTPALIKAGGTGRRTQ